MKGRKAKGGAKPKPRVQLPAWVAVWAPPIALLLTALLLLALGNADYLRKIESLSLFLPTSMFFDQCMSAPAGLLSWASLWLTQTFYHPWLGALVYALMLTALSFAIKGAFGLPKSAMGLAIVPSAMALLALLSLGYAIFSLKTPGYAFMLPLGMLAATLLFWGVRLIKIWWIRLVAVLAVIAIGYWATGFYGLMAGGLCALAELPPMLGRKGLIGRAIIVAAAVAAIVVVPKAWISLVGGDLMLERTYLYGLPRFAPAEASLKAPYWVSMACMALFALFGRAKWLERNAIASLVVGVLAISSVFACRNSDPNFRLTLSLDLAIQEGDWQRAVDRAKAFDGEPTRLNTVLADVATLRLGVAGDQMFALPYGSADYKTARSLRVMHEAGALPISYHLGFTNYAYRWAMESKVEYGANVDLLKYFAKCALLNSEYQLARKYLRILSMTANHKAWAEKYMAYADDPSLIDADPELSSIKAIMRADDQFVVDNHTFEGYVWRHLARLQGGSPQLQELSIMAALLTNDIDLAVSKMPNYVAVAGRLPKHLQEAAIMWAYGNDSPLPPSLAVEPQVQQRFAQFLQTYNTYGDNPPADQLQLIRSAFGDTYWHYFFYAPNMKII